MIRSKWKSLFIISDKKFTKRRSNCVSVNILNFNNNLLYVYNGIKYVPVRYKNNIALGHKFGEFSYTKKKCLPPSKKGKRKKGRIK